MIDDPKTKAQAKALLDQYYKQEKESAKHQGEKSTLPEAPNLLSWNLRDDGTMIVIDGASGRKLEFAPETPFKYIDDEVKQINAEAKAEAKAKAKAKAKK